MGRVYKRTYVAAFCVAYEAVQLILSISTSSVDCLTQFRYGLVFAASDLWKLERRERRRVTSNVNWRVFGERMNYMYTGISESAGRCTISVPRSPREIYFVAESMPQDWAGWHRTWTIGPVGGFCVYIQLWHISTTHSGSISCSNKDNLVKRTYQERHHLPKYRQLFS